MSGGHERDREMDREMDRGIQPEEDTEERRAGRHVELFGCRVDALTMGQTVDEVRRIVARGEPVQHVVLNAWKVVLMADNPELAEMVRRCSLINADGQSIVWAARFLGRPLPERVAGIDLMNRLIEEAERSGWKVYFLGAKQEVLDRFVQRMRERHPQLKIAGSRNGYFSEEEEETVAGGVAATLPDLLFVGISSPRKECFISRNLATMQVPFAMGVGGAFDVEAGVVSRAPRWMQRMGLEGFHRLVQEPGRMWRRYLLGNLRFAALLLKERQRRT